MSIVANTVPFPLTIARVGDDTGPSWIQVTPYTWMRDIVTEQEKKQRQIRSTREGAPFSHGHASWLPLKYSKKDGLLFGSILDIDSKKGATPRRQIPGGMLKNPLPGSGSCESFIEGAREEGLAEMGVLVPLENLYPAATITKFKFQGRKLEVDESSDKKNTVIQKVFASFGHLKFIETDDSDARDPYWDKFRNLFEPEKYFMSHIVIVAGVVKIILDNIEPYEQGLITEPDDLQFFNKFMYGEHAQRDSAQAFEVAEYRQYLRKLRDTLDLKKICFNLYTGKDKYKKGEEFLQRFRFSPLGSEGYFEEPHKATT